MKDTAADNAPPAAGDMLPQWALRHHVALAAIILLMVDCIVFGDVLFGAGGMVLSAGGADLTEQFLGWRRLGFEALGHGHLMLWNPYIFCGAPYFAGFQSALLYPPNWLYMVLPLGLAVNVGIALHFYLAGLFTYLWASHRRLHPLAALVAAMVFTYGGAHYMHLYAGHLTNLCTIVWAPLIFLAIDGIVDDVDRGRRLWRWILLGSGAVAMQVLAGHPQYVYFTAIAAVVYGALNLVRYGGEGARRWRRLRCAAALASVYVGGAALSAAQLLAGIQATGECLRSNLPMETAGTFYFPPENLLTAAVPRFFGDNIAVQGEMPAQYWGRWYLWEDSCYIGVTALALAVFGAVCGDRRMRRFSVVMLGLCLLLAAGPSTPLYRVLYSAVPGFASFRGVSKFLFLALMFAAVLAAVGLDRLLTGKKVGPVPAIILLLAGPAALVAAFLIGASGPLGFDGWWGRMLAGLDWRDIAHAYMPIHLDEKLIAGSALMAADSLSWCARACVVVGLIWLAARRWPKALLLLPALVVVELAGFARANRATFEMARYDHYVDSERQEVAQAGPEARILTNRQALLLDAHGLGAWGSDPMILRRFAEFMAFSQHMPADELIQSPTPSIPSPMWSMLRLSRYSPYLRGRPPRDFLQRAQLVGSARVIDPPGQMVPLLADPMFDPTKMVLLEEAPDPAPTLAGGQGTVKVRDLSTDAMEITADAPQPAILLISDNYSSGWHATAEPDSSQKTYRVMPGDYTLRAIPLAAGHHHLLLEYRPTAFVIGAWISVASVLAWLTGATLLMKRQLR